MNNSDQVMSGNDPIRDTTGMAGRMLAGDQAVFQELYDRVAPALYAWTRLRLRDSPVGDLDLQDILQEVWLHALRGFKTYDPARSFRGWVLGITKNVLLQGYRRSSYEVLRSPGQSASNHDRELLNCPDSVTSISTRFAKDEAIQHFLAYVGELDPDDRMLVLYCGIEACTCTEAATRLGLSSDVAIKRWQKLRTRLRESGCCRALALEEVT